MTKIRLTDRGGSTLERLRGVSSRWADLQFLLEAFGIALMLLLGIIGLGG